MYRYFLVLYQRADSMVLLLRQMGGNAGARPRKHWLTGAGALALLPLTGFASGDSLSARVRACAAETDSLQRLVCYDKSVAPFAEEAPTAEPKSGATTFQMQHDSKSSTVPSPPAQDRSALKQSRHIAAHVVGIDSEHGQITVHLDNGQVWEQVQEPTEELNLRAGDAVTVDKRSLLGTYWLSGRTGAVVKVRLKE